MLCPQFCAWLLGFQIGKPSPDTLVSGQIGTRAVLGLLDICKSFEHVFPTYLFTIIVEGKLSVLGGRVENGVSEGAL